MKKLVISNAPLSPFKTKSRNFELYFFESIPKCKNCLDKPRYGGPDKRRQPCVLKQCTEVGKMKIVPAVAKTACPINVKVETTNSHALLGHDESQNDEKASTGNDLTPAAAHLSRDWRRCKACSGCQYLGEDCRKGRHQNKKFKIYEVLYKIG